MTRKKTPSRRASASNPKSTDSGTPRGRYFSEIKVGDLPLDEVSSALHKSIRRGRDFDSAYWTRHLVVHGFGAYAVRKLSVVAVEDVGLGDPQAVMLAAALIDLAFRCTGKVNPNGEALRSAELQIVGAAIVLARAKHNRLLAEMNGVCAHRAEHGEGPEIPPEALDVHTRRGRAAGLKRGSLAAVRFWQTESRVVANEVVLDDDRWKKELDAIWELDASVGFVRGPDSSADGDGET